MTRLPTPTSIQHLADSLRALSRKPTNPRWSAANKALIDAIEHLVLDALHRDRTGTNTPDGYPSSTLGAGTHGNGSSVEAAVIALTTSDQRDRHHDLTVLAVESLDRAVENLQRCLGALASIDELIGLAVKAPRTCQVCTGKRGPNADRPVAHRGTVGDRLERALDLCKACYTFVEQTAQPGSHAGYTPSDAQIQDHETRGRWRIRVTAS